MRPPDALMGAIEKLEQDSMDMEEMYNTNPLDSKGAHQTQLKSSDSKVSKNKSEETELNLKTMLEKLEVTPKIKDAFLKPKFKEDGFKKKYPGVPIDTLEQEKNDCKIPYRIKDKKKGDPSAIYATQDDFEALMKGFDEMTLHQGSQCIERKVKDMKIKLINATDGKSFNFDNLPECQQCAKLQSLKQRGKQDAH